jgi:uncharacterized protein
VSRAPRLGRAGGLALLAIAVLAAWLASPDLPSPARFLTVFLITFLPALLLVQGRALRQVDLGTIPRTTIYLSSSFALWVLALVTVAAAFASGFTPGLLGWVALPIAPLVFWSAGITLLGVGVLTMGRVLDVRETDLLRHLLPRNTAERVAFVGVSLTAGICEELVFRSFLIPALTVVSGSVWAAVLISSVVFGFLHGYQGPAGIARTAALGFLLALPLLITGSILPSMIAHFLLDIIAGLWLADWLLRR